MSQATSQAVCGAVEALERRTLMAAGPGGGPHVVGDWNGDGRVDVAALGDGSVRIALGRGDGTFAASGSVPVAGKFREMVAGDWNGDGAQDMLLVGTSADSQGPRGIIAILIGLTKPNPQTGEAVPTGEFARPVYRTAPAGLADQKGDLVVGDFNGDGTDDLAEVGRRKGGEAVLIGLLLPAVMPIGPIASPLGGAVQVAAGDVNGDGLADLVGVDKRGMTMVSMNMGNGIFDDPFFFDSFAGDGLGSIHSVRVATGDVNGDGRAEIIAFGDGSVRVASFAIKEQGVKVVEFLPTGSETLLPYIEQEAVVADVDGDGLGDLVAFGPNGGTFVAFSTKESLFSRRVIRR